MPLFEFKVIGKNVLLKAESSTEIKTQQRKEQQTKKKKKKKSIKLIRSGN